MSLKRYLRTPKERFGQESVSVLLTHRCWVEHAREDGAQDAGRPPPTFHRAAFRCNFIEDVTLNGHSCPHFPQRYTPEETASMGNMASGGQDRKTEASQKSPGRFRYVFSIHGIKKKEKDSLGRCEFPKAEPIGCSLEGQWRAG